MELEAKVFIKAAKIVKKHRYYSCVAIWNCTHVNSLWEKFWLDLHSDTDNVIKFISEMDDAAMWSGLDKYIFREQLLRELAYSLRYQGFSK